MHVTDFQVLVDLLGGLKDHALKNVVGVALGLHLQDGLLVVELLLLNNLLLVELDLLGLDDGSLELLLLDLLGDLELNLLLLDGILSLNPLLLKLVLELLLLDLLLV